MDSATRERDGDESMCPMVLLPSEMKYQIISHISTQESLSRLGQSCRAWYEIANAELYKRDSREYNSLAIKWMAAYATGEQRTDSAIRTLLISLRWGGQIDAIQQGHPRLDQDQPLAGDLFDASTALHFAVFAGNLRLTKTLLDMKASLTIPCSAPLLKTMDLEELSRKVSYFQHVLNGYFWPFGAAFPIFLAFLQSDTDMCELLIERGAGREAMIVGPDNDSKVFSILHFAAVDTTADNRQWQCLFDSFRDYIDEPCPGNHKYTPLHLALWSGCTQGMQIAVEAGADKEAKASASRTPLFMGIMGIPRRTNAEEHTRCFRKFVELGASVNPEGTSLLETAVRSYAISPADYSLMRHVIDFLLEHHVDINRSSLRSDTNVVNEIIEGIFYSEDDIRGVNSLKQLLNDLVDRGLNLTISEPRLPSPLYRVLCHRQAGLESLVDLLCEKGATIHEHEVDSAFRTWCQTSRLWETNAYDAWWRHQGQEDEIFLKWCEHPYNAWWWQHVKHISSLEVSRAYGIAFHKSRKLYDILTHLPLPAPWDGSLVKEAFRAKQLWSWRLVVQREFEDKFLATWSSDGGENMIHLTVRKYAAESCYSTADAILDVLYLRDKGVNMSSPNSHGQTPLELLLRSDSCKDDFSEMVALFAGKVHKDSASGPSQNSGLE
ncbi:uncharacterized protein CPUR_05632 [Claviceps purpurea 20.1]|uniref:F-box domain-containing protein n=1 Tax=Claviceps purpurea (strain 20.1) TaxID=1111077 RepID=M1VWS4_CLAP2|nr:uncharacterized protein CPUR_05632 [Claviceps purpurea 20.1]